MHVRRRTAGLMLAAAAAAGLTTAAALPASASTTGYYKIFVQLGTFPTAMCLQPADPAALPGWLATTARRECLRVLCATQGPRATMYERDVETLPDERIGLAEQGLLAAERHAALREALAQLPPSCQELITLLLEDPLCHMPRSAPGWASRSAASARTAAATSTRCGATRRSPR